MARKDRTGNRKPREQRPLCLKRSRLFSIMGLWKKEGFGKTKSCHKLFVERWWMPLKADLITKDYVKDASIFADIFNYLAGVFENI